MHIVSRTSACSFQTAWVFEACPELTRDMLSLSGARIAQLDARRAKPALIVLANPDRETSHRVPPDYAAVSWAVGLLSHYLRLGWPIQFEAWS
jgi:hypothetical protein